MRYLVNADGVCGPCLMPPIWEQLSNMDKSSQYPIEAALPHRPDALEPSIFPYASDANIKTLKQIHEQTYHSVHQNEQATKILRGFSIVQTSPKQAESAAKEEKAISKDSEKSASKVCEIVFATHYNPTGHRTADGSEYSNSPYTARLQGVAVDKHEPVLNARLGEVLEITNLDNGKTAHVTVHDKGNFAHRSTPEAGIRRGVDFTNPAASLIGVGDMTKVEVCRPTHRQ